VPQPFCLLKVVDHQKLRETGFSFYRLTDK